MTHRLPLLALLALCAVPASADDFGLRLGGTIEKEFSKQFSLSGGFETRLKDNVTNAYRYDLSFGLGYKPTKWFGLGFNYVYINDRPDEEIEDDFKKNDPTRFNGYNIDHAYWRQRHRLSFDISGKHAFGRFTLSLRERYQYTRTLKTETTREKYRDPMVFPEGKGPEDYPGTICYPFNGNYFEEYSVGKDDKPAKDAHVLRSRLRAEYNIKGAPLNPYVSYEFYNDLCEKMKLEKQRLIVGTEWKITKKHRLDFSYLYDNESDKGKDIHCLQVSYKFKF